MLSSWGAFFSLNLYSHIIVRLGETAQDLWPPLLRGSSNSGKSYLKRWPQSRRCQQPTVVGLSGKGSLLWLVDSNLSLNFLNVENSYKYSLPPPYPYSCIYGNSIFPKAQKILFTLLISIYFADHCDLQIFFCPVCTE